MALTNDSFEVPLEKLRWRCPAEALAFATTDEINANATIIGQERAVRALKLGLQLKAPGYNVYVAGPAGTGKTSITKRLLDELQGQAPTPPDLCYVYNFDHPEAPQLLQLPAGQGAALAQEMDGLIERLRHAGATPNGTAKTATETKRAAHKANADSIKTQLQNRLAEIKTKYHHPAVAAYLERVQAFLLANWARWQERETWLALEPPAGVECKVNVVVDNASLQGAPVIIETAPTYNNLFGNIGRVQSRDGAWHSDFMQIKAGALARANGGYLLFNLSDALSEAGVWRMLKRTLSHRRLEIQLYNPFDPNSMVGLRPEPIALNVKLVVIADLDDYYHLYRHDSEFREIFKVRADFDSTMPNETSAHQQYAGFIKTMANVENLLPFDRSAVAAVIEQAVWLTGMQSKISTRFGLIADLLREANVIAVANGSAMVGAGAVQRAIEEKMHRHRLPEERLFERIRSGRLMIVADGQKVGQINALMVANYLDYAFGYPSRLTAAVGMGNAGVVNIEREADLSGKTHNKGVAIVTGYLRGKYAHDKPLSMSASIAFEQSSTSVDGDSASVAEVCAILSALAGLPLRQDLAVTGSLNQKGEIQGIGGVNEKIEGFFRACQTKGLTGTQGVIIPQHNLEDLMLRQEVIETVTNGKFHIYAVSQIDECLELLTGTPAGEKDAEGKFPEGTVHYKVDQRLRELNKEKKDNKPPEEKKEEKPDTEKKELAKPV